MPLAIYEQNSIFKKYHNGPDDPKVNYNIIYTMVKFVDTFYGRNTALAPAAVK